jgi:hypothetical protein
MEFIKKTIYRVMTTGHTTGCTGTCMVIIPNTGITYQLKINLVQDARNIGFFDPYMLPPMTGITTTTTTTTGAPTTTTTTSTSTSTTTSTTTTSTSTSTTTTTTTAAPKNINMGIFSYNGGDGTSYSCRCTCINGSTPTMSVGECYCLTIQNNQYLDPNLCGCSSSYSILNISCNASMLYSCCLCSADVCPVCCNVCSFTLPLPVISTDCIIIHAEANTNNTTYQVCSRSCISTIIPISGNFQRGSTCCDVNTYAGGTPPTTTTTTSAPTTTTTTGAPSVFDINADISICTGVPPAFCIYGSYCVVCSLGTPMMECRVIPSNSQYDGYTFLNLPGGGSYYVDYQGVSFCCAGVGMTANIDWNTSIPSCNGSGSITGIFTSAVNVYGCAY